MKPEQWKRVVGWAVVGWLWLLLLPASQAGFSDDSEARAFIDRVSARHGFERGWLEQLIADAERKQSIIDAMERAPERTKTWKEYRPIFVTDTRIEQGIEFWRDNRETLARAEQDFGVPASIVVAIIGIETRYGRHKGSYRVLDALSTLAFEYPPRSDFFASELEQFLLLVREQGFEPRAVKGSYAGAMGYGQFIPSSYRHYAIDYDGDGVADLIGNVKDAIGSVANYLHEHRWQRDQAIVTRATLAEDFDRSLLEQPLKPSQTLAELEPGGYTAVHVKDKNLRAVPFELQGKWGEEIWLALDNFYVITRYNRSKLYAMAVFDLSRALQERMAQ